MLRSSAILSCFSYRVSVINCGSTAAGVQNGQEGSVLQGGGSVLLSDYNTRTSLASDLMI